jgi:hypothetical protein
MIGIDFGTTKGAVAMADELGQVTTARCAFSHVRVARHCISRRRAGRANDVPNRPIFEGTRSDPLHQRSARAAPAGCTGLGRIFSCQQRLGFVLTVIRSKSK